MKTTKKATIGHGRVGETCTFSFFRQRAISLFAVLLVLAGISLTSAIAETAQNLFVSVRSGTNGIIYLYTPNGTKSTIASGLNQIYGLACDSSGDVYVATWGNGGSGNGSIFEYTPGGVKTTFASGLDNPACLAFDSSGDLFLSDYGDGNIYKFSGGTRSTIASGLFDPTGIACDSAGDVFVITSFGTIYEFTPGGTQSTFATISEQSESNRYFRLKFDSAGDLFVADNDDDAIYEFVNSGGTLSTSYTSFGSGVDIPNGLAFDNAGDLFEADAGSGKIQEYTKNNETGALTSAPATFASGAGDMFDLAFQPVLCSGPATIQNLFVSVRNGTIVMYTPNGTKSIFATGLNEPFGTVSDSAGDLYVSTWGGGGVGSGNIYKYTPAGFKTTFASGLTEPYHMAFDGTGDMFECDYGYNTVYKFTASGTRSTFATGLFYPSGIAVDNWGNVYVADGSGHIYEYTPTGAKSTFASGLTTANEESDYFTLAFDSTGDLFAADYYNGELYEFVNSGGTLSSTPTDFSTLGEPMGLSFDTAGDLFSGNELSGGSVYEYTNYNGSLDSTPLTFATSVGGGYAVYDVAIQSLGPTPSGYGTFVSTDPYSPYPTVPFYSGLACAQNDNAIYATAGQDTSGSADNGDAFAYGLSPLLGSDNIYTNILAFPGDYTDYGYFDSLAPTPAVGNNGMTYVVTPSGVLYAFNPDGTTNWVYFGIGLDGGNAYASPSIGLDGNIYVATDDGNRIFTFFCIDPDLGLPKWELPVYNASGQSYGPDTDASPLCTTNGIYNVSEDGYLHFMTYLGQEYNPLNTGAVLPDYPSPSPAIDAQGLLWVGTGPQGANYYPELVQINPITQSIVQQVSLDASPSDQGAYVSASPVIGPDGNIYVGTSVGDFYAVSESQAAIVAETNLGSTVFPTTAAVGSDSSVYFGTSYGGYDPTLPGTFYSLQLKPVCDQAYPNEFIINWQTTVTNGGFFGAPLIAQIGSNPGTNAVYAANANGSVYAILASSGPSTNTWSTFKGNDQRQDNWGRQSIPRPELWNVQFGSSNELDQIGKAAYGNTSTDYWNQAVVEGYFNPTYILYDYAHNFSATPLIVTVSSTGGLSGGVVPSDEEPFNDNLMTNFIYSSNSITITISNLPTQYLNGGLNNNQAQYDVYVYSYGGQDASAYFNSEIGISPTGTDPVTPESTESAETTCQQSVGGSIQAAPPTDLVHFTQNYNDEYGDYDNGEYVIFHNVQVTTESSPGVPGEIIITVVADPNNPNSVPLINGIQIVAKQ